MQEWLTIITVAVCVVIAFVAVFRRRSHGCGCSSESCGESSCCDCMLKKECDKNKSKKS